jgi:hypothetical protein
MVMEVMMMEAMVMEAMVMEAANNKNNLLPKDGRYIQT